MPKSVFVQSALASGLLTQADIDEAGAALRGKGGSADTQIHDGALAARLVELGRLNRWQAEQLRVGRTKFTLGPYRIIDSIGQGGMGQVFRAEHTVMGRVVAVKVLPRSKSTPESIESFSREIRAQAQLDHEHLVRAYDAGHDGNVYFLVTEYVPGTDLRRFVRRNGRLGMSQAASIISQAADGLQHAHERGLIHRDVKPGNILVTPEGHAKVSDLGLAGYFDESESGDASNAKIVGTADYIAPEVIQRPGHLTPASDIYSLGCTLYYSVTGKVPFPGGTARDKARAHCQVPPLDPRRLNPELSDEFVAIIAEMMHKDPEQRIQTAADVMSRVALWIDDSAPFLSAPPSATPPPGQGFSPTARASVPSPASLSDTEPNFVVLPDDDAAQSSVSQLSLGTHPFGAADEETLPSFVDAEPLMATIKAREMSPLMRVLIMIGLGTAALTISAIVLRMMYSAIFG